MNKIMSLIILFSFTLFPPAKTEIPLFEPGVSFEYVESYLGNNYIEYEIEKSVPYDIVNKMYTYHDKSFNDLKFNTITMRVNEKNQVIDFSFDYKSKDIETEKINNFVANWVNLFTEKIW